MASLPATSTAAIIVAHLALWLPHSALAEDPFSARETTAQFANLPPAPDPAGQASGSADESAPADQNLQPNTLGGHDQADMPQNLSVSQANAPRFPKGTIVILTSERRLIYFVEADTVFQFPIGIARRNLQRLGHTQITMKRRDPTWVPTSLQHRVYKHIPGSMPPGPNNPLGTRALNLGIPNIRIHGTDDDSFIGEAWSDGCYRMHNKDIEFLFDAVSVGTQVVILR